MPKKNEEILNSVTDPSQLVNPKSEYAHLFPLHTAVIRRDLAAVERLLKESKNGTFHGTWKTGSQETMRKNRNISKEQEYLEAFLSHRDWHGNPAIHLAVHFRYPEMVTGLLKHGADPMSRNGGGYSVVQEAICSGDLDIAEQISDAIAVEAMQEYSKRMPAILEQLKKSPDFTCNLKWEFKTWVPLLSRLFPHDTYRMMKRDSSFRIDFTLVGFHSLKWKRGEISFLLLGQDSKMPGALVLLDHQKKIFDVIESDEKPYKGKKDPKEILNLPKIHRANLNTNNIKFSPVKGWFGRDKTEKVGDFDCKVYEASGFDFVMTKRHRNMEVKFPPPDLPSSYFEEGLKEGKGKGLIYPTETVKVTHKQFKGTLHMTDEFPYNKKDMLPILEVVAPRAKHFERLKEFIQLKLPEDSFPVRTEIPLFTALAAAVTFLDFQMEKPDKELFVIPSDYTEGRVEFDFDFVKKDENDKKKVQDALNGKLEDEEYDDEQNEEEEGEEGEVEEEEEDEETDKELL